MSIVEINMNRSCRTCLTETDYMLNIDQHLQTTSLDAGFTVSEVIMECARINVCI